MNTYSSYVRVSICTVVYKDKTFRLVLLHSSTQVHTDVSIFTDLCMLVSCITNAAHACTYIYTHIIIYSFSCITNATLTYTYTYTYT